jgi:hypothetical protein
MFPMKSKLVFYIPEDGIFHSHRHEDLKPYVLLVKFGCELFTLVSFELTSSCVVLLRAIMLVHFYSYLDIF